MTMLSPRARGPPGPPSFPTAPDRATWLPESRSAPLRALVRVRCAPAGGLAASYADLTVPVRNRVTVV